VFTGFLAAVAVSAQLRARGGARVCALEARNAQRRRRPATRPPIGDKVSVTLWGGPGRAAYLAAAAAVRSIVTVALSRRPRVIDLRSTEAGRPHASS
jgi:hypothetical protein